PNTHAGRLGLVPIFGVQSPTRQWHNDLPGSNPLVLGCHRNFRIAALEHIRVSNSKNLHYSVLMAISHEDKEKIRDLILEAIQKNRKDFNPLTRNDRCPNEYRFFRDLRGCSTRVGRTINTKALSFPKSTGHSGLAARCDI